MKQNVFFRELRTLSHRAIVILGSIALGVAAITSVHALADSIREGIRLESRPMIAGDLVARSMHPFPEKWTDWTEETSQQSDDVSHTKTFEMMTMASDKNGRSTLVELKAVSDGYPLYGDLELQPQQPLGELLDENSVVVQESLLRKLERSVGDEVFLNGIGFVIKGIVLQEPDRMNVGMNSGPRILMSEKGLERSTLMQFGSRITRRIQYRASPDNVGVLEKELTSFTSEFPFVRVQGGNVGQPSAQRGISNTERFLSMVAMLAMLIGCIGVVQSIQSWLRTQKATIATYRCLGLTRRDILELYAMVVSFVVLVGACIGVALSYFGLQGLFVVISPYLPIGVEPKISWLVALEGIAMGLGCALLSIAYPLRNLLRIPPLAALRSDVEPAKNTMLENIMWGSFFLSLLSALSIWQARDIQVGLLFAFGVVAMVGLLFGGAYGTAFVLGRFPIRNWVIRHSFSSFRQPSLGLGTAMVALGLGVMVVVSISILQFRLQNQFDIIDTTKAPTNFLLDIQNDQIEGVNALIQKNEMRHSQSAPVVMARLSKINGTPLSEIIKDADESKKWSYTREQRLTYGTEIDPDTFVSGTFPSKEATNELCLEVRYAERWGVEVGDTITFDVLGIPLDFEITALRRIQWETFNINFFLVAEEEYLKTAPQFRLMAGQLTEEQEENIQRELSEDFPNVTVISLREILTKVTGLFQNLSQAVKGMGFVSVLAGLLILVGTLQTTALQRQNQVQLLRTLGSTSSNIRTMFLVEFSILGVVSGGLGVLGAVVLTWGLQEYGLRIDPQFDILSIALWFLLIVILTVISGFLVQQNIAANSKSK